MRRRKFILGFGGVAAGASAAFGTGAFTAAQVNERQADIAVVNDADGLVGLVPNPQVSGVHDDGGELTIDLSDPGINQNSIYQFGFFVEDSEAESIESLSDSSLPFRTVEPSIRDDDDEFGSAFLIANQTGNTHDFRIWYELNTIIEDDDGNETVNSDEFETEFWFEVHKDGEQQILFNEPTDDEQEETVQLGPGEAIGVSFLLNVPGDTLDERLEGSLRVRADAANS